MLDLTAEFSSSRAARRRPSRSLPLLDLVPPTAGQLEEAVAALRQLQPHGPVLVHCALGLSRSAAVAAAWLLHQGYAATPVAAVALVQAAQPRVVLGPAHLAALATFQAHQPASALSLAA